MSLLRECSFVLYGFDPYGQFAGQLPSKGLRDKIRIANPPKKALATVLIAKRDKNKDFRTATKAGFLFGQDGDINTGDPWVREMMSRRDGVTRSAAG